MLDVKLPHTNQLVGMKRAHSIVVISSSEEN